jgi:hypothetical protein
VLVQQLLSKLTVGQVYDCNTVLLLARNEMLNSCEGDYALEHVRKPPHPALDPAG